MSQVETVGPLDESVGYLLKQAAIGFALCHGRRTAASGVVGTAIRLPGATRTAIRIVQRGPRSGRVRDASVHERRAARLAGPGARYPSGDRAERPSIA